MENARNSPTITDGGVLEERFELDVDLPEDSIFDIEDYLEMYEVASKPKQFQILTALEEDNELSRSELCMKLELSSNKLQYPLRTLKDVALIKNRRDPTTGTEEPYSYYELTDLARIVLSEGIAEGVEILARQEASLEEKYSK